MESLSSKMFSAAQGFFRLAADGAGRGQRAAYELHSSSY